MEYSVGDFVRCIWGRKPVEYEAKILHVNPASKEYFVHYQGWNKRYDEWLSDKFIIGPAAKHGTNAGSHSDTPKIRQSKREKKTKKPIDWSPMPSSSSRVDDKPVPVKVLINKYPAPNATKRKSPAVKTTKPSKPQPVPHEQLPSAKGDSTEESTSSDEEDGDDLPVSYIDVLAKAKKRAEKKDLQRRSLAGATQLNKHQSKHGTVGTSDSSSTRSHGDQEDRLHSATISFAEVPSTSAGCHGFASIGGDHNYSSLRFLYNETPLEGASGKDATTSQVTSTTQRTHILPIRRPLDNQYFASSPFCKVLKAKSAPINLPRRRAIAGQPFTEPPPDLGSPFSYSDEYHASYPAPEICEAMVSDGEAGVTVTKYLSTEMSDGRTISTSNSESDESMNEHARMIAAETLPACTVST